MKPGTKVRVYRNLNRKSEKGPVYSVMDCKTRLVIGYATELALENVKFVVSKAGQRRARSTGKRNVHAFVEGTIVRSVPSTFSLTRRITYNPFRNRRFIDKDRGRAVDAAQWVEINNNGVFAHWRY